MDVVTETSGEETWRNQAERLTSVSGFTKVVQRRNPMAYISTLEDDGSWNPSCSVPIDRYM
jgi:hypothetical protein